MTRSGRQDAERRILSELNMVSSPGDLVLFGTSDGLGKMIQSGINSPYSHCGIVYDKTPEELSILEVYPTFSRSNPPLQIATMSMLEKRKIESWQLHYREDMYLKVEEMKEVVKLWEDKNISKFSYWNVVCQALMFYTGNTFPLKMQNFEIKYDSHGRMIWKFTCVSFAYAVYEAIGFELTSGETPLTPTGLANIFDADCIVELSI